MGYMKNLEIERENLLKDMEDIITLFDKSVKNVNYEPDANTRLLSFFYDKTIRHLRDEIDFVGACINNPNHVNKLKNLIDELKDIMQRVYDKTVEPNI
eukprot:gene7453-11778_t